MLAEAIASVGLDPDEQREKFEAEAQERDESMPNLDFYCMIEISALPLE
jgi:hypothetical protein